MAPILRRGVERKNDPNLTPNYVNGYSSFSKRVVTNVIFLAEHQTGRGHIILHSGAIEIIVVVAIANLAFYGYRRLKSNFRRTATG